jgi:mannose-6-phosphate isomerase-like protein (cupin superfamily)
MAHCRLAPGAVTRPVRHRTVDELWLCLSGAGQLWRGRDDVQEIVDLEPHVAVSIPVGVSFQFRAAGDQPLELVIVTMPPWPGQAEAVQVEGAWPPRI